MSVWLYTLHKRVAIDDARILFFIGFVLGVVLAGALLWRLP